MSFPKPSSFVARELQNPKPCKVSKPGRAITIFALQIAGMKLEGDKVPPVQRHSAPGPAPGKPEEPVAKHVTAPLRQSAPAPKVKLCLCVSAF